MIFFNTQTPITELENYLHSKAWLQEGETIVLLKAPGEGNMNVVFRIQTDCRSFILKQSRPYVQKYQEIPAPIDRIDVEYRYYQTVHDNELTDHFPKILGYAPSDHLFIMEDLGQCESMVPCYQSREILTAHLGKLIKVLNKIHAKTAPLDFPKNLALRQLNHQHIFVLPFMEDNGFQLDIVQKGLDTLAKPYKTDLTLKKKVESLGKKYLSEGDTLLHGDYYPGSWMTQKDKIYIIDPEFSFVGFPEFDLGVMAAHLIMATMDFGYLIEINNVYQGKADRKLIAQIAGVEIIRRLIGLAQLPMHRSLDEKRLLLQTAKKMILS